MSAQIKLDTPLDYILGMHERDACSLCDHHFVGTYRGMGIIGISFGRNAIFTEKSLFLKMKPKGLKKAHLGSLFFFQICCFYKSISVNTNYTVTFIMSNCAKLKRTVLF